MTKLLLLFICCFVANPVAQNNSEKDTQAIIHTLNQETKDFFNRDYRAWSKNWVHGSFVVKTYMNTFENTFSETLGWESIDAFAKNYIIEHPKPDKIPVLVDKVSIRFYEKAAWVSFLQMDPFRGLKRETRLMEKENGHWKIAGMHTTIYGLNKQSTEK